MTVCPSCMQANFFKEALESCQAVLKQDPDNVKALFRAGKVSYTTSATRCVCNTNPNMYMCVTTSTHIPRLCSMGMGLVQFRITIASFPGYVAWERG